MPIRSSIWFLPGTRAKHAPGMPTHVCCLKTEFDAPASSLRAQRSNPDCIRGDSLDCFAALAMMGWTPDCANDCTQKGDGCGTRRVARQHGRIFGSLQATMEEALRGPRDMVTLTSLSESVTFVI